MKMKKANLLSKAEMKKVMGGVQYSGGVPLCDASNGTLWTTVCYVNGMPTTSGHSHNGTPVDLTTWDSGSPCGGVCEGVCKSYYVCNDQPVGIE